MKNKFGDFYTKKLLVVIFIVLFINGKLETDEQPIGDNSVIINNYFFSCVSAGLDTSTIEFQVPPGNYSCKKA